MNFYKKNIYKFWYWTSAKVIQIEELCPTIYMVRKIVLYMMRCVHRGSGTCKWPVPLPARSEELFYVWRQVPSWVPAHVSGSVLLLGTEEELSYIWWHMPGGPYTSSYDMICYGRMIWYVMMMQYVTTTWDVWQYVIVGSTLDIQIYYSKFNKDSINIHGELYICALRRPFTISWSSISPPDGPYSQEKP